MPFLTLHPHMDLSNPCAPLREIDQADMDLATARAQLALAGWSLHELSNCAGGTSFVAAPLATTRVLPDRHALRQFLRLVGSIH